jgi:hypothetical protein
MKTANIFTSMRYFLSQIKDFPNVKICAIKKNSDFHILFLEVIHQQWSLMSNSFQIAQIIQIENKFLSSIAPMAHHISTI